MDMNLGHLIHDLVRGLHNGQSSEVAAGVKNTAEYPRLGQPTKALYLAFDIRASFYPSDEEKDKYKQARASCSLHYLFNCPYGSRGFVTTHTFATVQDSPFAKLNEIKSWDFLSSHDSCWRDAAQQKAWQTERDLVEIVSRQAGFDECMAHSRISWFVSFPTFNDNFYRWVDVQINKDENDKHSYDKLIKVLTKEVSNVQAESCSA